MESQPLTDIFCVTYGRDAKWADYMLRSTQKYAIGFNETIVAYPNHEFDVFAPLIAKFQWVRWLGFDENPDGHMHQNLMKCTADLYCDADFICHIDSDCVFMEKSRPSDFFTDGRPDLLFNKYASLTGVPWQGITEAALGFECPNETMRRFPFVYPRFLYKALRDRVEEVHKKPFEQYVFTAPCIKGAFHGFSEFESLGSLAIHNYRDSFHLYDMANGAKPLQVRQYWSYSGLTDQEKFDLEWVTNGWDSVKIEKPAIRKTRHGFYVPQKDTHLSRWVDSAGRIDHFRFELEQYRKFIPAGGVVVDAGAMIGAYTYTFAEFVGEKGRVYAFEPNPDLAKCVSLNNQKFPWVWVCDCGLSDKEERAYLNVQDNIGASFVGSNEGREIILNTLDSYGITRCNFIKVDIEGCEPKFLDGAKETILTCKPTMFIEVNRVALNRQGFTKDSIFDRLKSLGYSWKATCENYSEEQYDILARPQ